MPIEPISHFFRASWPAIVLSGGDRLDFLHRLTSQSFRTAQVGDLKPAAFLTAKGAPEVLFLAWIEDARVVLLTEPAQLSSILSLIEKFHFGEDIAYGPLTDFAAAEIFVASSEFHPLTKESHFVSLTEMPWASGLQNKVYFGIPKTGSSLPEFCGRALGEFDRWKILKANGFPEFGVDIASENILVEAAKLEAFVHRNKGCYPGQEVIERIATYGNVAKQLLKVQTQQLISALPCNVLYEGRAVGRLTSSFELNGLFLGLATVKRLDIDKTRCYQLEGDLNFQLNIVDLSSDS
jgi:folate-binding protein YgfZ